MSAAVVLDALASRDEWLAARQHGLGGSDVAAACGLNKYVSPFALWLEKTGQVPRDEPDGTAAERMYWGHVLEPLLAAEFGRRHPDLEVRPADGMYADEAKPWMLANLDGLIFPREHDSSIDPGAIAGFEAKTGGHRTVKAWADDEVPIAYVCQVQWYMRVLGLPRFHVAALLDTSIYVEKVVERDDELIADLEDAAGEFWQHVQDGTEPPADGSEPTKAALSRLAVTAETAELDSSWHKPIRQRHELNEQMAALKAQRDGIDNKLRAAIGNARIAELDGEKVATFTAPSVPSRTCDYTTLHKSYPEAYGACVTEKPASRRLTYTKDTRA